MLTCRYEPLFNMFGVDLLLFGHVHAYERTNPVSNYQADASGCSPVYITIGTGRLAAVPVEPPFVGCMDATQRNEVMDGSGPARSSHNLARVYVSSCGGAGKRKSTCCKAIRHRYSSPLTGCVLHQRCRSRKSA